MFHGDKLKARKFALGSFYHFLLLIECVLICCAQYTVNCCLVKEMWLKVPALRGRGQVEPGLTQVFAEEPPTLLHVETPESLQILQGLGNPLKMMLLGSTPTSSRIGRDANSIDYRVVARDLYGEVLDFFGMWVGLSFLLFCPFLFGKRNENWLLMDREKVFSKGETLGSFFGLAAVVILIFVISCIDWHYAHADASATAPAPRYGSVSGSGEQVHHSALRLPDFAEVWNYDRVWRKLELSGLASILFQDHWPGDETNVSDHSAVAGADVNNHALWWIVKPFECVRDLLTGAWDLLTFWLFYVRITCKSITILLFIFLLNQAEIPFLLRHHPKGQGVLVYSQLVILGVGLFLGYSLTKERERKTDGTGSFLLPLTGSSEVIFTPGMWTALRVCFILSLFFSMGTNLRRLQVWCSRE